MDDIQINYIKIHADEVEPYVFNDYANMPHAVEDEDEDGNKFILFYTINQYDAERINDG